MNNRKANNSRLGRPLEPQVHVVDNRTFLHGLDHMYRMRMKELEGSWLLPCARKVAQTLNVAPADVPVEGYFDAIKYRPLETDTLAEYFRLMRALQTVPQDREAPVRDQPEYQILLQVAGSPLYGRPQREGKLLPVGRDPLSQALLDTAPHWNVDRLTQAAYLAAVKYDDYSLVGLAALLRDSIALTALRESVVLYAPVSPLGFELEPIYEWRVDETLAVAANRFITAFNRLSDGIFAANIPGAPATAP